MKRRVWAPYAKTLALVTSSERVEMRADTDGRWSVDLNEQLARTDYGFSIDRNEARPDPRSPSQPDGPFGLSRPLDHTRFKWTDAGWRQAPLGSALIYECHIGTFSKSGTFDGAIERLSYLKDLGVTHLEVMPVAEFEGERGWGYDGVDLWAPHHAYGGPDGLKRLVDACHAAGLGAILDVVYNHLGPSGNFLQQYGPYHTNRYKTPWGDAINLDDADSDEVRRFLCDNALMWLRDYHFDALRLDAVHAIFDSSAIHFLEQLASEVHTLEAQIGRPLAVIAESDLNQPRIVTAPDAGGYGLDAQWSDDFHHAIHALLTGERSGYYEDFGTLGCIAKALVNVFVYNGNRSKFRRRAHGRPVRGLTGDRFVVCIQNHDQVGNRAMGERLGHLTSPEHLKLAAALLITSPYVPLLFQGEEWAASSPFQYFVDYRDSQLAAAVRDGRRKEFAHFIDDPEKVPDPQAPETFMRSKLNWDERDQGPHREILDWYRSLIALRHRTPDLSDPRLEHTSVEFDEVARWLSMRRGRTLVVCNFADLSQQLPMPEGESTLEVLLASSSSVTIGERHILMPPASVAILTKADDR
jgi:maltooligosyltrehalose trehalohydrolase